MKQRNTKITQCILSATVDWFKGQGIYLRDGVNVTVINSIIYGNSETQIYFRSTGDDVELVISLKNFEIVEKEITINGFYSNFRTPQDKDGLVCPLSAEKKKAQNLKKNLCGGRLNL